MCVCSPILNFKWCFDSVSSKHMNGDINIFSSFTHKKLSFVSYGDNNKGRTVGFDIVGKYLNPTIEDVLLVKVLNIIFLVSTNYPKNITK